MNKKAAAKTFEKLMGIVVVLVVLFILLYFIAKPYTSTLMKKTNDPVEQCRQTVALMSAEKQGIWRLFTGDVKVPFDCQTNWYGTINITETNPEKQKEQALDTEAKLMSECWYQFYQGEKDPFAKLTATGDNYCFLCSRFEMDYESMLKKSGQNSFMITNEDINQYLQNNMEQKTKTPYSEYLSRAFPFGTPLIESVEQGTVMKRTITFTPKPSMFSITSKPQQSYAIMLFAMDPTTFHEMTGIGEGASYRMFIMPYENFDKMPCTRLEKKDLSLSE